jgi:hypothetical protein
MEIEYQNYTLAMEGQQGDHELSFKLYYQENDEQDKKEMWNCTLKGLWEDEYERETAELRLCWDLHQEGDYFQQTIARLEEKLLRNISFTAIFHEIIRINREDFNFINNIYSTSTMKELSMGYKIYPGATRFWTTQVANGFAEIIEDELRFKAILEVI